MFSFVFSQVLDLAGSVNGREVGECKCCAWRLCPVVVACSFAFSFRSGKQALWTVAMFQCPFCPSHSVLVTGTMAPIIFGPCFPMACGGGSTKMNGGTLMRQGPHKAVGYVCLEKNLAGVPGLGWHGDSWDWWEWKAEGWEELGTSIVNHCLYFELGRLEEAASLASPSNSTCSLPQGKRNQGNNFSDKSTPTQPADWLAFVENGTYLRRWLPKCRASCEWSLGQSAI